MNSYDFAGQRAVVTGGAQGLGLAIAELLQSSGAQVEVWDRLDPARSAMIWRPVDVTKADDVAVAAEAAAATGPVDVLVCSAGVVGPRAPLWEYTQEDWSRVLAVNLDGVFLCCRAVVPAMRSQGYGRIALLSSIAGKEGNPLGSAYSSAKAGVIALTKSLGKELANLDIAVNCVTPTVAKTPLIAARTAEQKAALVSQVPRKRFVTPDEVARLVGFIVSRDNSFTTGAVFDLSGGRATY